MSNQTTKKRVQSERVQEHNNEFARAGKATRTLQNAFRSLLKDEKEARQTGRLTSKMHQVITSDPIHGRGKRTVTAGDIGFLEGFDFTLKGQLLKTFYGKLEATIDRKTGQCVLHVPPFDAGNDIRCDTNYTHIEFVAAASVIDFERESFVTDIVQSKPMDIRQPVSVTLTASVSGKSTLPIVFLMAIRFHQAVNGQMYMMAAKVLNIVKADSAPRRRNVKNNSC